MILLLPAPQKRVGARHARRLAAALALAAPAVSRGAGGCFERPAVASLVASRSGSCSFIPRCGRMSADTGTGIMVLQGECTDLCEDMAALALHAAVQGAALRGAQIARPRGLVLSCYDGVRVGLLPAGERARLAAAEARVAQLRFELGSGRADRVLHAVNVIQGWAFLFPCVRRGWPGLLPRRPARVRTVQGCGWPAGCHDRNCHGYLLSYVPPVLLPRLHAVVADHGWYFSLPTPLRRAIKHWCARNPSVSGATALPPPLICGGTSLLSRLTALDPAALAALSPMPIAPSLGGTQPVTDHTTPLEAQAPPVQFGGSAVCAGSAVDVGASVRFEDARDAWDSARAVAAECSSAFGPAFHDAIFDAFGVGDEVSLGDLVADALDDGGPGVDGDAGGGGAAEPRVPGGEGGDGEDASGQGCDVVGEWVAEGAS